MPPPNEKKPDLPLIGEHYQLLSKLGEGAFGEVFRAHHDLLDQDFAVKLLKPELSEDKDVCNRFLDEARALIRFSHPNVVQMRHVGRHQGRLFLVMDFVEGVELGQLMRKHGAFSEARALNLISQILHGLESAHAAGIVHRDLKPSNILVETLADGSEKPMVLDFGLSKFSAIDGPGGAHRSITGTIVGTLAYMSPEQIKGDKDIDGRSDLFAAGLILQEMLQGHHPYPGESGIVVAAKLLRDPIPPIDADKAANISESTKSALGRALERDRDARFASVTAFAQCLEGRGPPSDTSKVTTVLEAQQELARQEKLAAERSKAAKVAKRDARVAAGGGSGKKGGLLALIAVAVLALGAGAFFFLGQGKGSQEGSGNGTEVAKGLPTKGTLPGQVEPKKDDVPTKVEPKQDVPVKVEPKKDDTPTKVEPKKDDVPTNVEPKKDDTPTKVEPKKDDVPTKAEPKKDDPPTKVEPKKDDVPTKVEPKQDDPPTKVEPTKGNPGEDPAKAGPDPDMPPPVPATPTLTPQDCCVDAARQMEAGEWASARALYRQAAEQAPLKDDVQVTALRGVAASWLEEADAKARSGDVAGALALYAEGLDWLKSRHAAFERVEQAVDTVALQLGYSRMHQAGFHVESARWLGLTGRKDEAAAELELARVAFDFALQTLDRRGVHSWEFLIHRAQMHRLTGDTKQMIEDMRYATKTKDTSVPPHMWVAHASAERRVAQALARQGQLADALTWARQADKVATDGVSWQENPKTGDYNLTREQWLAMVRVVFVLGTVLPTNEDPNALHGRLNYWLDETKKKPAAGWIASDVSKARLLEAEAMERYLAGRVAAHRSKAGEAAKIYADALAKVTEAERLRLAVAASGGRKVDPLLYEVKAAILAAQGQTAEARAAMAAAQAASAANPD